MKAASHCCVLWVLSQCVSVTQCLIRTGPSDAVVDSSLPQRNNGLLPPPERRGLRPQPSASAPSVVVSAPQPASLAAATTAAASTRGKCAAGFDGTCHQASPTSQ